MSITLRIQAYQDAPLPQPVLRQFDQLGGAIGRISGNELVLDDPSKYISRVHAKVDFHDGGYYLTDVGSNPSLVNERPLGRGQPMLLADNDRLTIGDYQLLVTIRLLLPAAAAPSPLLQAPPVAAAFAPMPAAHAGFDDALSGASILDVGANFDFLNFDPLGGNLAGGLVAAPAAPAFRGAESDHVSPEIQSFQMPASRAAAPVVGMAPVAFVAALVPMSGAMSMSMSIPDDYDPLADFLPPRLSAALPATPPVLVPVPAAANVVFLPDFDFLAPPPLAAPTEFVAAAPLVMPEVAVFPAAVPATPVLAVVAPVPVAVVAAPPAATQPATVFVSAAAAAPPPVAVVAPSSLATLQPAFVSTATAPPPIAVVAPSSSVVTEPAFVSAAAAPPPAAPELASAAATSAAPAQAASDSAIIDALLRGLGLSELKTSHSALALVELAGAMLREATNGTMGVLTARAMAKRESRLEMTMMASAANNPLKFFPDADMALAQMLGSAHPGYMAPARAYANAYDDLKAHELATLAGMRAALAGVLQRFDPAAIEQRLQVPSVMDKFLASSRKAKMWDRLVELYGEISNDADADFQRLFGEQFGAAYEEQVQRLRK